MRTSILRETSTPTRPPTRSTRYTLVREEPHIVAELCISDDPDYTRGYVCAGGIYTTVTHVKRPGDPHGGRVMLYDGPATGVASCIEWLQHAPVLVSDRR
ncbi:hypothetical protein FAM19031_001118 [Propionibacterium freudenreichii]|uniref:6-carboxyhexanoate--CoA ligase n=1 Tax=Propionibacterium freudenreichii TaxID=1744 RepID=UPI00254C6D01|nr:6-carboxyhexanoate--CoA ligase [Propionibacterium freudenreichii]MDK9295018.1 hypothetical protein [Propionibacterium freudenreichii]MDK9360386.1 hypothetical protein [Propionibacterium freudenreichii]